MKTNADGLDLIRKWEGCRLTAYQDAIGVWTIGYGHTTSAGPPAVKQGLKITAKEATDILTADLVKFEAAVVNALKKTPTDNQFAAMVSLCFNIGPGNFSKSTVLRKFNAGDIPGAADAFRAWTKAAGKVLPGLVRRREDERKLFLTP